MIDYWLFTRPSNFISYKIYNINDELRSFALIGTLEQWNNAFWGNGVMV